MIRDQAAMIHTQGEVQKEAIGNLDFAVKPADITAGIAASGEALKGAVAGTMKDLKISEDIGNIRSSADSVASEVAEIQKIFLDKQAAAGWAEIELERILKDSFANVSIRKKVPKLDSIPDASLNSLMEGFCVSTRNSRSRHSRILWLFQTGARGRKTADLESVTRRFSSMRSRDILLRLSRVTLDLN